jgi:hypothetical protein
MSKPEYARSKSRSPKNIFKDKKVPDLKENKVNSIDEEGSKFKLTPRNISE